MKMPGNFRFRARTATEKRYKNVKIAANTHVLVETDKTSKLWVLSVKKISPTAANGAEKNARYRSSRAVVHNVMAIYIRD